MIKIFSYLYDKTLYWSSHHRASYYLAALSFAESSFFPIPPDVMLMSMGLAKPRRSLLFACIATLFSVLGGVFGYGVGFYGMALIEPYLMASSYAPYVTKVTHWFLHQGLGLVILACFSPFPYKIFTITSGMMQMAFWPFLIGSIIGRGLRFFLVSGILFFFGAKIEPHLRRSIDYLAWGLLILMVAAFFLSSCSDSGVLAPVEELKWQALGPNDQQYVVRRGDTLYAVAFRYDLDYRQMALYNHLQKPYTLRIGQILRLKPFSKSAPVSVAPPRMPIHPSLPSSTANWTMPAKGDVVVHFSPAQGQKGVNIAGQRGDKIYAASGGIVAYAGNGLTGYGNLIIIKHNKQFMTAYGHNLRNHVREGQRVLRGQVIADMGMIERQYWGVHFEIRQFGKPVDPLRYIE